LKEGVKSVSMLKSELNELSAVDTFKGGLGRVSSSLASGRFDFTLNSITFYKKLPKRELSRKLEQ